MGKDCCCKRCFVVPNINSPITVTGVTGSVATNLVTFSFSKKCKCPPSTISIGIASITGTSPSALISLVNISTGVTLASVTVTSAPGIVTLSPLCSSFSKCNSTYAITVLPSFGTTIVINSISSAC